MPVAPPAPPAESVLRAGGFSVDLSRPCVMGILNVTPDSFSDGGQYLDPHKALDRALRIESEGAALIDVGAESSRPGSACVPTEEELRRLLPVLKLLRSELKIPVSVDTWKYEVMERALGEGASIVNDIRAMGGDPRIPALLARSRAGVILMHMRGTPETMQHDVAYGDLVGEVIASLRAAAERALAAGVRPESIVVDPGVGFGKSPEGNMEIIRSIGRIRQTLPFPVLIGASRKSFLAKIFGEDADLRVLNASVHALTVANGARILRAHDVRDACQAIRLTLALTPP